MHLYDLHVRTIVSQPFFPHYENERLKLVLKNLLTITRSIRFKHEDEFDQHVSRTTPLLSETSLVSFPSERYTLMCS